MMLTSATGLFQSTHKLAGLCLWIFNLIAQEAVASSCGEKLGPAMKRDALLTQPDEVYQFIVRGESTALAFARTVAIKSESDTAPLSLESFRVEVLSLRVRDAETICAMPTVDQVWYLNPTIFPIYRRALSGLQYVFRTLDAPNVINMSLGPPAELYPIPGDDAEPIHFATRRLSEKGLIVIIAIGNFNEDVGPGAVNPWCYADWVVCVGATSADGRTLWSKSSRGAPAAPRTWPDVVAHGADVIGAWPTQVAKSDARRAYDVSNADFLRAVPPDKRELFTLMSGTSQAAAQVSRAAGQVIHFIRSLAEAENKSGGEPLFTLSIPRSRFDAAARRGKRLTGSVVRQDDHAVEVQYKLVEPWRLVKQLLLDTAMTMPGYEAHEVGAGFVSPSYVEAQFGRFGLAPKKLLPVKVD